MVMDQAFMQEINFGVYQRLIQHVHWRSQKGRSSILDVWKTSEQEVGEF